MRDETRKTGRSPVGRTLLYAALLCVTATYLLPLIWMLSTSLKTERQVIEAPTAVLPEPVTDIPRQVRDNYLGVNDERGEVVVRGVLNDPVIDFPLYLRNTLVVAILSVTGMVLSSAVVAYGFSRVRWRGRGVLFGVVLATMMIPFPVIMGPMFILFRDLGWIGSLKPLWVPAWFASAYNVFLLRQFFMTIPRELDEAATVDGCTHLGVFWRIILPNARPALAVVALFHFMFVWNDFLGPLIFLVERDDFTLALGLQLYQAQAGEVPWNLLMAASTLVMGPVLLAFLLAQRTFVEGLSTSGLKE
ncbi:MAG: carbohydrate ABC transporter permease [Phycisphaerales bacterium JB040]